MSSTYWTCPNCNRFHSNSISICTGCNTRNPAHDAPNAAVVGGNYAGTAPEYAAPNISKQEPAPPSYDAAALPPGWEMRTDQWNRVYYIDHNTQSTHWEPPTVAPPVSPQSYPPPNVSVTPTYANPDPLPNQVGFYAPPSTLGRVTGSNQDQQFDAHYDPNVLTATRMDAYPRRQWTRDQADFLFGPLAAIGDTIWKNKLMCFVVLLLWGFISLIIVGLVAFEEPEIAMIVPGAQFTFFFYILYLLLIACPACGCCGQRENTIVSDVPRRALDSEVREDYTEVRTHLQRLEAAAPVLTLHVECYHMRSTGSGKKRRTKKVVTFTDSRQLPVRAWKDLSPSPLAVTDSLDRYGADFSAVRYEMTYELCPEQQPVIDILKREYENLNRHRDNHIRTWYTYGCVEHDEFKVDNVAKRASTRYLLSRLWVNNFMFYLCLIVPLYPIYLIVWKLFQKPYYLNNHKLMYLERADLGAVEATPAQINEFIDTIAAMDV